MSKDVKFHDVKDRGGPKPRGLDKCGRESAYIGNDTDYSDKYWLPSRGDAVCGTARLDSDATLFLFRTDFSPSLIEPMKATSNIHGYDASMTKRAPTQAVFFLSSQNTKPVQIFSSSFGKGMCCCSVDLRFGLSTAIIHTVFLLYRY